MNVTTECIKAILALIKSDIPKASPAIDDPCTECPLADQSNDLPSNSYVKIKSYYKEFQNIGVGHTLTIENASGKVIEKPIKLPMGKGVEHIYGPYPPGRTTIEIEPTINYNKNEPTGTSKWKREITLLPHNEVEVKFEFIETDTWDKRYTTKRIKLLHPKHRQRFLVFINKIEEDTKYQFRVADGLRTLTEQDTLYCNNRKDEDYCINKQLTSGDGTWKSNAKGGKSYHNYGLAVDIYRFDKNNNILSPDQKTELIGKELSLNWGNSFGDPPHFEWNEFKVDALQELIDEGKTTTENGLTYPELTTEN
jgi:hypothetical protein